MKIKPYAFKQASFGNMKKKPETKRIQKTFTVYCEECRRRIVIKVPEKPVTSMRIDCNCGHAYQHDVDVNKIWALDIDQLQ